MIVIVLLFISLVVGVLYLIYWILKAIGYPKVGKYLSIGLASIIIVMAVHAYFEDELFSKSDARELLAEQNVQIIDDFNIEKNESTFSPGDYYHTFILNITIKDKVRIIEEIKGSLNFNKEKPVDGYSDDQTDYYNGPKRINNYETEEYYVRELFEPHGEGYAATWRKIEIDKKSNKLIFEDIDP